MALQAHKRGDVVSNLGGLRPKPDLTVNGVDIYSGALSPADQEALIIETRKVVSDAPLFHPVTRRGQQMSVKMTSAGHVGWISDRAGYRYERNHPSGRPWPAIPAKALAVWDTFAGVARAPDSCLINFYATSAKMGLHQDLDEASFEWPVLSISLGDDALFRVGGMDAPRPTKSVWLKSGDIAVLRGNARLAYHGIDRVRAGSSRLLREGGRLNLTLRVAT